MALGAKSTAEATQAAVSGEDAVAGNDNRDWVFAQRITYSPRSSWLAYLFSYPAVTAGLAVRNAAATFPNLLLKLGTR